MRIRRVILKRVRNFHDFDRSFEDSWTGRVPDALLLMGPNGSGKSTLLFSIAQLWQTFADFLTQAPPETPRGDLLASASLAAVEITDFSDEPVWIYSGALNEIAEHFVKAHPQTHRISVGHRSESSDRTIHYYQYTPPGKLAPTWMGEAEEMPERLRQWADALTENRLGKRADLPNIVYLPGENRQLLALTEHFSVQPEPEDFRWLAEYEPTTSRRGSLQNYLYNLKVVDEAAFNNIVTQVNVFLAGKRLNSFDRRGNFSVRVANGDRHPIEELSSGEKQVLLMLAMITRWLRPGGIVLVDEPDLHLHVSLASAFVSHLQRTVSDKGGQLIIASHMPELWELFTDSHRVRLDVSTATGESAR